LVEHCVSCHGPEKQKGGLRLDSRAMALTGGSGYGPAIVPGKGSESPLLRFSAHLEPDLEMPPKKPMLSEETLAILRAWIDQGAEWPGRAGQAAQTGVALGNQEILFKKAATHWAFQPVVPAHSETLPRGSSAIDAFVDARRQAKNLSASPQADAPTLLKRIHFDLTGLPPSPADMDRFVADFQKDPGSATTAKVDQLLASPHFGERWGRHWLDIARYADTPDFLPGNDVHYPFAWTYRDYVVNAFNQDKPYDQFLKEQLAADLMDFPPEHPSLAALGLLTLGPRFLKREDEQVNDRIDVVTRGIMGLTVVCARCHDHKFDAIPTTDFYALFGVFKSTEIPETLPLLSLPHLTPDPAARADYESKKAAALEAVAALTAKHRTAALESAKAKPEAYFDGLAQIEFSKKEIHQLLHGDTLLESALDPLLRRWTSLKRNPHPAPDPVLGPLTQITSAPAEKKAERLQNMLTSGKLPGTDTEIHPRVLRILREKAPANEEALLRAYGAILAAASAGKEPDSDAVLQAFSQKDSLLDFQNADVERVARRSGKTAGEYIKLNKIVSDLESEHAGAPVRAMALKDRPKPIQPVVYLRGDPTKPGKPVDRRFLEVLDPQKTAFPPNRSGRKELAERIASPTNPLTPRVWANHVWRHLLGRPLVKTTGDFGLQSEPPTHPELLDWLASALVQRNWSTKQLIRDIVLSRTYQQSSANRADATEKDADNTWLWRANQRRRDFESMRDAMLTASGQLDPALGGRSVQLSAKPFTTRRTLYGFVDRVNIDPLFTNFDFPSPDISNTERSQTLVPQQALFALNDAFIVEQACMLASKAQEATPATAPDPLATTLRALYRLVYQRIPSPDEETLGRHLLRSAPDAPPEIPPGAWQHGFGSADPHIAREKAFHPLPHFDQKRSRYQGARAFPNRSHGYVSLSAGGGHPGTGPGMAAIRRWVAPYAGTFAISGELAIAPKGSGDGIRARLISSEQGLLAEWIIDRTNGSTLATQVPSVKVQPGEILDFTVDCRETDTADGFRWAPTLHLLVMPEKAPKTLQTVWDAQADFKSPPPPKLTSLERIAQALLITNEFLFID
jgi:cytochrome c553